MIKYEYQWDELGRMVSASRSDGNTIAVTDRYAYDARLPLPPGSGRRTRMRRALLARALPTPDLVAFGVLFGEESFIRALDTTGAPLPETDLFVGLSR